MQYIFGITYTIMATVAYMSILMCYLEFFRLAEEKITKKQSHLIIAAGCLHLSMVASEDFWLILLKVSVLPWSDWLPE